MPAVVVLNGKEKIRRNFKEDRTLVSVNFEIRKKKERKENWKKEGEKSCSQLN